VTTHIIMNRGARELSVGEMKRRNTSMRENEQDGGKLICRTVDKPKCAQGDIDAAQKEANYSIHHTLAARLLILKSSSWRASESLMNVSNNERTRR
jgi:hypothetical protein